MNLTIVTYISQEFHFIVLIKLRLHSNIKKVQSIVSMSSSTSTTTWPIRFMCYEYEYKHEYLKHVLEYLSTRVPSTSAPYLVPMTITSYEAIGTVRKKRSSNA